MAHRSGSARIARNGFRDITATLKVKIEAGDIVAGAYLPTERELQAGFGASRATIRKALAALVEAGWAMNVPNKGVVAARGLKPGLAPNVALICGGSYVLQVLASRLGGMLEERGFHLVSIGGGSQYPLEYALQRAVDNNFMGALVWSYCAFPDREEIKRTAQRLPIVAMDHRVDGVETDLVTFDHQAAAYTATEHLIRQGSRRIGVTGMLDVLDITHQRFSGYLKAMFDNGLQPDPKDFLFTMTSGIEVPDTESFELRLKSGDGPDAFLVLQDICVPAAVEAALRAGLTLPNDLKLATIGDDLDLFVEGFGLTAVALDWETLAEQAVELLTERLENLHRPVQVRNAPHRLVVRGLCGAHRDLWTQEPERIRGFRGELPVPRSQFIYTSSWGVQSAPTLTVEKSNNEKSIYAH